MQQVRSRCRNINCKSKLPVPTDNHHKAFCTPYCYNQFYSWKCKVCEEPILKGKHRKQPDHCHRRDCRLDFKRFPETFLYPKRAETGGLSQTCDYGSRSAHFTGVKSALKDRIANLRAPATARIIAGPALSEFSLWAATLDPPPYRPISGWVSNPPPGTIAAEWAAAEWARREADDAEYVKADEERIRSGRQLLPDGNFPIGAADDR